MGELKILTPYELVDALVASKERSEREMERAIPSWESTELRQRAAEAGLPIAEQQGMNELVYLLTDGITSWTEDLSQGWGASAPKRATMEKAHQEVLEIIRNSAATAALSGWNREMEAKRLLDEPSVELTENAEFARAKETYMLRRHEYILEFGTVHSHLGVRQQQLQDVLDGFTNSRDLPGVILEFRESGATVPGYGRGAAIIMLNNTDLLGRSRAPLIVSLIAGQLAVSHHDMQIVRSLIDRLSGGAPKPGVPLSESQVSGIMESYRKRTGAHLSSELLQRVADRRKEVLNVAEVSRADSLARSFNATRAMTTVHQHRAQDIRAVEAELKNLYDGSDNYLWDLIRRLYNPSSTDNFPVLLFGANLDDLKEEHSARQVMDRLLKIATEMHRPGVDRQSETAVAATAEAKLELCTLIEERILTMKDLQKRAQKEYLQNLHARESVVLSSDAYSLSVARLSKMLKYSGPRPRKSTGMEDSCVHHDHTTYLDVHGL